MSISKKKKRRKKKLRQRLVQARHLIRNSQLKNVDPLDLIYIICMCMWLLHNMVWTILSHYVHTQDTTIQMYNIIMVCAVI